METSLNQILFKITIFHLQNEFENVTCKMMAI